MGILMIGRTQVMAAWSRLRSTYWFVPAVMTVLAIGLAVLFVSVDRRAPADSAWVKWAYGGGADGARALLSAVAGSVMTVVSLTFSMTVVALTVSSQHFGPRLLSHFMRDTAAQVVLGMFIGTFAFCLLVLRTVQGEGEGEAFEQFVPHLSVTLGVALAMLSVAALIYYLHHVAASMQVSQIALNVTRDLEAAIDRLYPEHAGAEPEIPASGIPEAPAHADPIRARSSGYAQAVDLNALVSLGEKHDTTIWLRISPGGFVTDGGALARVSPVPADMDAFADSVREAYVIGKDRTPWQDAEFAVQQLVEVALHALSPGINEPFTAITCIDRLGQGLSRLVTRAIPSPARTDRAQQTRVVAEPQSSAKLIRAAFDPITLYAGANPAIYRRLLETLAALGERARRGSDRETIRDQASMIRDGALQNIGDDRHRRMIEDLHAALIRAASDSDQTDRAKATPAAPSAR